ncbi:MAG: hypothetical protein FJ202_06580 [Gemmatimonadetes bacterium]|nr:hypothetical protein [Gemmatimonadota bacterium]
MTRPSIRTLLAALAVAAAFAAPSGAAAQSAPDPTASVADNGRIIGSDKAPIWMLVVSDYQCPFCKDWHAKTWNALKTEYVNTGKVRVAFVHFPLGNHRHARPAAIASMCGSAQGKFWQLGDAIFNSQERWKDMTDATATFEALAKTVGLDMAAYKTCIGSKAIAAMVDADRIRMSRAGTGSTPTFFIGGSRFEGAQPLAEFRRVIDAELAAAARTARKP